MKFWKSIGWPGYEEDVHGIFIKKYYYQRANADDILIMKSIVKIDYDNSVFFTKLEGAGIVKNEDEWYCYMVNWFAQIDYSINLNGILYRTTFESQPIVPQYTHVAGIKSCGGYF